MVSSHNINTKMTLCIAGRLLLLKIVKIWNIMEVGFLVWAVRRNAYELCSIN